MNLLSILKTAVEALVTFLKNDMMVMENTFEKGAVGFLHHHPHTQITYVASGAFQFEIDGVKNKECCQKRRYTVQNRRRCSWLRVPVCLETGVLLDIFTYREKLVED